MCTPLSFQLPVNADPGGSGERSSNRVPVHPHGQWAECLASTFSPSPGLWYENQKIAVLRLISKSELICDAHNSHDPIETMHYI